MSKEASAEQVDSMVLRKIDIADRSPFFKAYLYLSSDMEERENILGNMRTHVFEDIKLTLGNGDYYDFDYFNIHPNKVINHNAKVINSEHRREASANILRDTFLMGFQIAHEADIQLVFDDVYKAVSQAGLFTQYSDNEEGIRRRKELLYRVLNKGKMLNGHVAKKLYGDRCGSSKTTYRITETIQAQFEDSDFSGV